MPDAPRDDADNTPTTGSVVPSERDANGRFRPGSTANPHGRPRVPEEVRDAARALSTKAIKTLERLLDDEDGRVAVAAANSLLDRAWGKPTQHVEAKVASTHVSVDLSHLSAEELRQMVALTEKVCPSELPPGPGAGLPVIEAVVESAADEGDDGE